jgi:hypothetical protein
MGGGRGEQGMDEDGERGGRRTEKWKEGSTDERES